MKKIIFKILGWYFNKLVLIAPDVAARQGFKLFCYPIRPTLAKNHKAFLDAARSETFVINKDKIQVYKWGNGPKKILFVHGWQSHSFRWKSYVESLSGNEYTLYAFDAPGHGNSGGSMLHLPMFTEVIDFFISKKGPFDAIVGHSLGCFAIIYSLYKQPKHTNAKLVILGTPGAGMDFYALFKKTLHLSDRMGNTLLERFKKISCQNLDYFSLEKFAANLENSGLIIHEKTDREAPFGYAYNLHSIWKNSSLVYTEGLDHKLKSDRVVSLVKKFLTSDVQDIVPERTPVKLEI